MTNLLFLAGVLSGPFTALALANDRAFPFPPTAETNQFDDGSKIPKADFYLFFAVFFNDTEGLAGMSYHGNDPRLSGRIGLEDGTEFAEIGYATPIEVVHSRGVPFWWESNNPWTGKVRGWAKSSDFDSPHHFVFPAPGSDVGLFVRGQLDAPGISSVGIDVSLADTVTGPSPLYYDYMSFSGRSSVLSAVYLPGNVLFSDPGIESHFFGPNDLAGDFPGIYWADYEHLVGPTPYSSRAPFSTSIPYGPILISMIFDGSTTARASFTGYLQVFDSLDFAFAPLPGSTLPTATQALQIDEPPAFVMTSSLDAALVGDSIDLTSDLDYYCDRNHDGMIDCADMMLYHQSIGR